MGERNDILSAEHSIKTSDRSGNPPTRKVSFLLLRWDARCSGVVFLEHELRSVADRLQQGLGAGDDQGPFHRGGNIMKGENPKSGMDDG